MDMVLAVNQPNYWPSLSFWQKLTQADVFVLYDNAQFTQRDFHHRQRIRSSSSHQYTWLTIPVHKRRAPLKDIEINHEAHFKGKNWQAHHLNLIKTHYKDMPGFDAIEDDLHHLYGLTNNRLVEFNTEIIRYVLKRYNIKTNVILSSELNLPALKPGSLGVIQICQTIGAKHYLSGLGAKTQRSFNPKHFEEADITLEWLDFTHPTYNQPYMPFIKNMGCIDALCSMDSLLLNPSNALLRNHSYEQRTSHHGAPR